MKLVLNCPDKSLLPEIEYLCLTVFVSISSFRFIVSVVYIIQLQTF